MERRDANVRTSLVFSVIAKEKKEFLPLSSNVPVVKAYHRTIVLKESTLFSHLLSYLALRKHSPGADELLSPLDLVGPLLYPFPVPS